MQPMLADLFALLQIVIIDVVLAGDNALVVGLAASRVAPELRQKVIFWGIAVAVATRIAFALVASQLLLIVGLTLAGGVLLLWVAWKMFREFRMSSEHDASLNQGAFADTAQGQAAAAASFRSSVFNIALADISMSLDNVLAVAGAAKGNTLILGIGLVLSVVLMGWAASLIAKYLTRYRWVTWVGLVVIVFVALDMIWRGTYQICQSGTGKLCDVVQSPVMGWGLILG